MNELSTVKTAPLQQEQKQTKTGKPYMKADNCTMTDGTDGVRVFKLGMEKVKAGDNLKVEFNDQFGASGWVDIPRPKSQASGEMMAMLQAIYDDLQLVKENIGITKEAPKSKWEETRDKFKHTEGVADADQNTPDLTDDAQERLI